MEGNEAILQKSAPKDEDYIFIPWNHKRDYELLFSTISILEKRGFFLKYKIIDWGVSESDINAIKDRYSIKSGISYSTKVDFDVFLETIRSSKFVLLPLENEKDICNWLTVFALVLSLWKLLITNENPTTKPFFERWTCIYLESSKEKFADAIQSAYDNPNSIAEIWQNAYNFAHVCFSFLGLFEKILKELS